MTIGTGTAYLAPLAHQGGWDELLVVLAPLLILVGVLILATRRVNARLADDQSVGKPSNGEISGDEGAPKADVLPEDSNQA